MHWRAHADHMRDFASYDPEEGGVVSVVREELARRVDAIEAAGIDLDRVVLDPGLGFAKRPEHDWAVLRGLDVLHGLGLPLLVGASRKSFLGRLLGSQRAAASGGRTRRGHDRADDVAGRAAGPGLGHPGARRPGHPRRAGRGRPADDPAPDGAPEDTP